VPRSARIAALAALVALAPALVRAELSTPGFRAVGVAHAAFPISALAVAPDGRLFAAIQAKGGTVGTTPGTAEIRVYTTYATTDGALLDEGTVWATVDGVRATTSDEGLLGIALAPDFTTSKLVYVYLTTTDDMQNQNVRVYRENAAGTGDLLGVVAPGLEPPVESSSRNGGPIAFGVDGCLYVGVGDNGSSNRWNAQLLVGTDPVQSSETTQLCTDVCLGPALYPDRTIADDGNPNDAGKILRLAVEGASTAQPAPGAPFATQPFAYGTGLRNPAGLGIHPLTGQLWVTERGDSQQSEVDVVDLASDLGWPCVEGSLVSTSGVAGCLVGHVPDDVYANHPEWRRPLATHDTNPTPTGITAYTGLAYPAEYYGDVFYLLRASARIYRVDLDPPCFLPHPNGVTALPFHDSVDDGDFSIVYDIDGDGELDFPSFTNLTAIVQAPNPLGQQVLYVAGKQGNSSTLDEDSVIFRIEYATAYTPYAGSTGRVPDACFTDGTYSGGGSGTAPYGYENPFSRATCLPPGGPCPGMPDGTACDDGDPCNGAETCLAGICRHGTPAPDGTTCVVGDACHAAGTCQAGACVAGPALPDGTPCAGGDPCGGQASCSGGACVPTGGPQPLSIRTLKLGRELHGAGSGTLALTGSFHPAGAIAPESTDALTLELRDASDVVFSTALDHPASDPFWRRRHGRVQYAKRGGGLGSVLMKQKPSGNVDVTLRGRRLAFTGLDDAAVSARLRIGAQCFTADLSSRCTLDAKKLRCR
jgi:glucose/arabinose dehydrogenase